MTHRPSGAQCAPACKFKARFCGDLPFHEMRKMKTDSDGVVVVKCDDFKRQDDK
jgi:hypothetical protein